MCIKTVIMGNVWLILDLTFILDAIEVVFQRPLQIRFIIRITIEEFSEIRDF
jgi:hypothetical protein